MKLNKKGFTLIELLAVIVILGLLMAIAIPSVTKYINQSRMKTMVSSIDGYIQAVTTAVNDNEYGPLSDTTKSFYIPVHNDKTKSCVALEKGGTDPYGNWKEAYVIVSYNETKYSYDYYFTFYDDAGYGMIATKTDDIRTDGKNQIINPIPKTAKSDSIQKQKVGSGTSNVILKYRGTGCTINVPDGGNADDYYTTISSGLVDPANE